MLWDRQDGRDFMTFRYFMEGIKGIRSSELGQKKLTYLARFTSLKKTNIPLNLLFLRSVWQLNLEFLRNF